MEEEIELNERNDYETLKGESPGVKRAINFTRTFERSSPQIGRNRMGEIGKFIFGDQTKLFKGINVTDTKMQEFLYYKYDTNALFTMVFALISCISAIVSYEIENNEDYDYVLDFSLWICSISSIGLWMMILMEFNIWTTILYYNKNLKKEVWRKHPDNIKGLIVQLAIFFIHPNYFTKGIEISIRAGKYFTDYEVFLNSFFSIICLMRFYWVIKGYLVLSDYHTPRVQRLCEINNFNTSLTFSLKANFKANPSILLLLLGLILIFCSFSVRVFEREIEEVSGSNFSSYFNTVWCLIITMTTVGYGDFMPATLEGRLFGIIACFSGIVLISLTITAVTNVLEFSNNEKSVFDLIEKAYMMEDAEDKAANMISKYIYLIKKLGGTTNYDRVCNNRNTLKLMNLAKKDTLDRMKELSKMKKVEAQTNESSAKSSVNSSKAQKKLRDKLLMDYSEFRDHNQAIESIDEYHFEEDYIIESFYDLEHELDDLKEAFDDILTYMPKQDRS